VDRPGKLPGGLINEVSNIHSSKIYVIGTAPEIGQDYWSTAIMPATQQKVLFGLLKRIIPDFYHPIASFLRNNQKDAHQVRAEVRHIVSTQKEETWFSVFPSPAPPEGYSKGAKEKLRGHFGDDPSGKNLF
jgi:hypothetical protein